MRTVLVGGGKGAEAIIRLAKSGHLKEMSLDIQCVADPDPNAPGIIYAREQGLHTSLSMDYALALPDIELILELTGDYEVLERLHKIVPRGVILMDHTSARVFWELARTTEETLEQLEEITALEERIESERLFLQNLVDNLPDLMAVLDKDRKALKVNASFSRFAGVEPAQAIGKTCEELLAGTELADGCRDTPGLTDEALESGKPHAFVVRTTSPKVAYWEVSRVPILDRDGNIEALLATWHRITERVRLQQEVATAEQRFRSFIDSAEDWISIKDQTGRYVIVNPICASAFKRQPEEFVGRTPDEMFPEELARSIRRNDQRVLDSNRPDRFEEVFVIDGRDRHFQTVRFPLHDYRGRTIGVCTIARDVTSELQLREQLAQAAKLAAVGKLAAGVAHEINNPLTGILAFAEDLIEDLGEDSPHFKDMKIIIRETLRCRDIVRNLLDFARQETLNLEIVDPNKVVDRSLSLLERLPEFRNIELQKHLTESIVNVKCDVGQIQQVILNLVLNAQDAMNGKGVITVTTEYDRRRDKCIISVEDDGPGIPENMIDKVFEPFFSTKGTSGLGLAVSWGIVERHRGVIEVDIAESGGAIFRVVLPVTN